MLSFPWLLIVCMGLCSILGREGCMGWSRGIWQGKRMEIVSGRLTGIV
jgi:hypothetical protein